ncbi:drug resistance transporter [Coccidioides immitis RMSCC 3703]|uniref:Drug resistance transporter n=1 Tax=Coccidioides immitis RMSCC 3703 TaxID=454286 RepID=A0A0J8QXI0_COCIT|nr:drug resistance transporter [Coccidioides immitis RMSCC 3703]
MALARSSLARVDDAMTLPRRVRVPRLVERHRASCFAGRPKANKQGPGVSNALINGRTVQGIGGGGIGTLVDIIISDLVPMRERGKYVALMAAIWAFGTVIGPVLRGALAQHVSWRWIFYINLPLSAASLFLLYFFLKVSHPRGENIFKRLSRVDFLGNGILVAAVVSILLSLTWAAVLGTSSTMSGLYVLPITAAITPLGILTGILIAATGKYRAFHFLGFGLMSVGVENKAGVIYALASRHFILAKTGSFKECMTWPPKLQLRHVIPDPYSLRGRTIMQ